MRPPCLAEEIAVSERHMLSTNVYIIRQLRSRDLAAALEIPAVICRGCHETYMPNVLGDPIMCVSRDPRGIIIMYIISTIGLLGEVRPWELVMLSHFSNVSFR